MRGGGPALPLVLLPGIRGDAREWDRLRPHLGDRELYTPDLPPLTDPRTTLADVAAALLPRLPAGPAAYVGASFGGLVARALPSGRVSALLTIGTLPFPDAAQRRAGRSAPLVRRLPAPLYRRLYGARAARDWLEDDPDPERYAALRLPGPAVLAARLAAIGRWGLPDALPPGTLWAWGATDRWVTWSHADVERLGATPLVLPGGHRPHLSHPAEVARWL